MTRETPSRQKRWSAGRRGMPQSMHQSRPTQPANLREAADPGIPQANSSASPLTATVDASHKDRCSLREPEAEIWQALKEVI
jgi:hypothetical protein